MYRYHEDYRENVRIGDGTLALLRLVTSEDQTLLQDGFRALSPQTRYYRFFAHKQQLSTGDLDYLTKIDHSDHLAIGAVREHEDAPTEPLGIARFVRQPGDLEAEAAVVVVDAYQGQGLGRMLLERLGEAAHERGIQVLSMTTLAENRALQCLVRSTFSKVEAGPIQDGTRTFSAHLDHGPEHPLTHIRRTASMWAEARLRLLESFARR